jgi:hypothetical protein
MAGINIDPHDMASLPAGEDLSAKQFFLVTINAEGKVVIAKAGEIAFCLLNTPKEGEGASIAVPLQVKGVAAEEIKAGWKLKVNAAGELVKATAEAHVIGVALMTGVKGALITYSSTPSGATG